MNLFNKLSELAKSIFGVGEKYMQFKVEMAQLLSDQKQPLALSILTVLFYLVFQIKTIFITDYLFSYMFYIDLTLMVVSVAFQFNVSPKWLLKTIKDFSKQKKEK